MFSNVQFLTMEENCFVVINEKKPRKHFISENALFYTQILNTLFPPYSHPPILAIKLLLAPKVTVL